MGFLPGEAWAERPTGSHSLPEPAVYWGVIDVRRR